MLKTKLFIFFVAFFSYFFVLPFSVSAIGQIASPIIIENAVNGQEYQELLTLFNSSEKEETFKLTATDDIGDWSKFFSYNTPDAEISEFKIGANSSINAIVKFFVPDSVPNDTYKGRIVFAMVENTDKGDANVAINQQISRKVSIKVTNDSLPAGIITIKPEKQYLEENEPLKIGITTFNSGNVTIKPYVELEIQQNDKTIDNIIYPYDKNKNGIVPRGSESSIVSWQTANYQKGKYKAIVKVYLDEKIAKEDWIAFSINNGLTGSAVANLSEFLNNKLYIMVGIGIGLFLFVIVLLKKNLSKRQQNIL